MSVLNLTLAGQIGLGILQVIPTFPQDEISLPLSWPTPSLEEVFN